MEETTKKGRGDLAKRVIWVILANVILGLGISLLRLSSFGTDPFTCMNLGVSSYLPIGYGTYQMLFNLLLFIPVFILDRKSFGIGALINMLLLGYIVDAFGSPSRGFPASCPSGCCSWWPGSWWSAWGSPYIWPATWGPRPMTGSAWSWKTIPTGS